MTISANGKLPTDFMGVLGKEFMPIGRSSTTVWGEARLRVALALDNTGSMASSNKLTALKTATHSLLDQLKDAATIDGDVYVSIIPFVKDVNVGSGNYDQSWVKWDGSATQGRRPVGQVERHLQRRQLRLLLPDQASCISTAIRGRP